MCAIGFCIVSLQRMSNNRISAVSCQDIFESQKQGLTDITSYKRVWILHQTLAVLADIIQASHTFLLPVQVNTQTHSHTHWKSSEGVLCHCLIWWPARWWWRGWWARVSSPWTACTSSSDFSSAQRKHVTTFLLDF